MKSFQRTAFKNVWDQAAHTSEQPLNDGLLHKMRNASHCSFCKIEHVLPTPMLIMNTAVINQLSASVEIRHDGRSLKYEYYVILQKFLTIDILIWITGC